MEHEPPEIKAGDIVGLGPEKYGNWRNIPFSVLTIDESSKSAEIMPTVFVGLGGVPFPDKAMLSDLEPWRYWDKDQKIPLLPFG